MSNKGGSKREAERAALQELTELLQIKLLVIDNIILHQRKGPNNV